MEQPNIRNFVIIAHIDSGKSTLADRFLELTGTVDARHMVPQYLDRLELERERGITIKMAPVRMHWRPSRGLTQIDERIDADQKLLHGETTYRIRGALFNVYNSLGPGHKENVYQNALAIEFGKINLSFEREKRIDVIYSGEKVGIYQPDFVVEDSVVVELKALPFLGAPLRKQARYYLKGSGYRLALLVNFGGDKLEVERIIYDSIRDNPRESVIDPQKSASSEYILNLIDTPGHSDFSYEVSRALAAVEGAILLVDGTKGIQAQTLSNLRAARKADLKIIGAVNKIDLQLPHLDKIVKATAELLGVGEEEIFRVSAKTGEGAGQLLAAVVDQVPPPSLRTVSRGNSQIFASRALIFDSLYDDHKGILAFVRVFGGEFGAGEEVALLAAGAKLKIKEVGCFSPELRPVEKISAGGMGYIATGLKEPNLVRVGDTVIKSETSNFNPQNFKEFALPGYKEPSPVVFISFYPDGTTKFEDLKRGLERLRLTDAALSFEPDANEALGRGLKVGFLGQLHFEITASRLRREFNLEFLTSFPSIAYRIKDGLREFIAKEPHAFPDKPEKVWQPMIRVEILTPQTYLNQIVNLKTVFDLEISEIRNMGENLLLIGRMPLAELIRDFDDRLKSVSAGYASFNYELAGSPSQLFSEKSWEGWEVADVEKLEILIIGDVVPALTRIVPKKDLEREGRVTVERLKKLLPKEQFAQAIQASAQGRIIARETIPAVKKLLGNFGKTGGDRTRKMKLWKKQQRGKEKLQSMAKVELSPEVFREILKK